jgi:hypothetical protein
LLTRGVLPLPAMKPGNARAGDARVTAAAAANRGPAKRDATRPSGVLPERVGPLAGFRRRIAAQNGWRAKKDGRRRAVFCMI